MRMARSLLILLMIVIALPWGAYAKAWSSPARLIDAAVMSVPGDPGAARAHWTDGKQDQPSIKAASRCRTITLPGFSCSPEQAVQTETLPQWPVPLAGEAVASRDLAAPGRSDPPPKEPPRSR